MEEAIEIGVQEEEISWDSDEERKVQAAQRVVAEEDAAFGNPEFMELDPDPQIKARGEARGGGKSSSV